ncbi:DUF47 domain-containing protein [Neobacillus sp. MER 74]|uniref:DUF47 domain-containing protein n=1 Tax=Bacillaceae TaxID=186817 RepID=UPI000BF26400|nr:MULTISPECIES: DUF47 domain-containing protein [Bacillaceae]MCM3116088.1 DUF47 domain-containing protein [Neobacillus sp. MER 74]PFP30886.1 hypothetical protein COJ96_02685 [Bacillus sp. AFS073361]
MARAKRKDKFFNYLLRMSLNLKASANYFADYNLKNVSDLVIFSEKMKEFETYGDTMVHDLIGELNNAFITPIEREDILALSISMDDILDGLYHTAALFEMYSIIEIDEYMLRFVDEIKNCVTEIDAAIELLSAKKMLDLREHTIKITEMESDCDHILRDAIRHLFTTQKDPIRIIKHKQIYEGLEEIANSCKAVANTLETIIMKNA